MISTLIHFELNSRIGFTLQAWAIKSINIHCLHEHYTVNYILNYLESPCVHYDQSGPKVESYHGIPLLSHAFMLHLLPHQHHSMLKSNNSCNNNSTCQASIPIPCSSHQACTFHQLAATIQASMHPFNIRCNGPIHYNMQSLTFTSTTMQQ